MTETGSATQFIADFVEMNLGLFSENVLYQNGEILVRLFASGKFSTTQNFLNEIGLSSWFNFTITSFESNGT